MTTNVERDFAEYRPIPIGTLFRVGLIVVMMLVLLFVSFLVFIDPSDPFIAFIDPSNPFVDNWNNYVASLFFCLGFAAITWDCFLLLKDPQLSTPRKFLRSYWERNVNGFAVLIYQAPANALVAYESIANLVVYNPRRYMDFHLKDLPDATNSAIVHSLGGWSRETYGVRTFRDDFSFMYTRLPLQLVGKYRGVSSTVRLFDNNGDRLTCGLTVALHIISKNGADFSFFSSQMWQLNSFCQDNLIGDHENLKLQLTRLKKGHKTDLDSHEELHARFVTFLESTISILNASTRLAVHSKEARRLRELAEDRLLHELRQDDPRRDSLIEIIALRPKPRTKLSDQIKTSDAPAKA